MSPKSTGMVTQSKIMSTEFPRLKSLEAFYCHKCGKEIREQSVRVVLEKENFHYQCFNRYEHYYGLDKPCD